MPVAGIAREIAFRSVVLPAPLGPRTPTSSPLSTVIDTDSTARALPYRTLRSATSSRGMIGLRSSDIGFDHARIAHDIGGRRDRDDLAEVDRDDARDQRHELAQLVLDQKNGEVFLAMQTFDQLRERLDFTAAEPGEG